MYKYEVYFILARGVKSKNSSSAYLVVDLHDVPLNLAFGGKKSIII